MPSKVKVETNKDFYKSGDIIKIEVQTMNFWNNLMEQRDFLPEAYLDAHSFEGKYTAKNFSLTRLSKGKYFVEIDAVLLKDAPVWNIKLNQRIFKNIRIER